MNTKCRSHYSHCMVKDGDDDDDEIDDDVVN